MSDATQTTLIHPCPMQTNCANTVTGCWGECYIQKRQRDQSSGIAFVEKRLSTLVDVKAAIDAGDIERARALFNAGIQFVGAGQVAEPEWLREARNGNGPSFFVAYINSLLAANSALEAKVRELTAERDAAKELLST